MTEHDHAMIHLAMNRQPVVVEVAGRTIPAKLIAWKPARRTARVEYTSGARYTVPADHVHAITA